VIEAEKRTTASPEQVEVEVQSFLEAVAAARSEVLALSTQVTRTLGADEADILLAQHAMLEDPDLLASVQTLIREEHLIARAALQQTAESLARDIEALDDATLAARGSDIRDISARVIRHLTGEQTVSPWAHQDGPVLLVAYDLTPSDTAGLDRNAVLGICTVVGGPTTHAAILARALEIPAVAGIDAQILDSLSDGQEIAIDGTEGLLYLHPSSTQRQDLHAAMRLHETKRHELQQTWRRRPATTSDGYAVQVFANVGDKESAQAAGKAGAEGIGLLRTEFLFASRTTLPDEQEQFEIYTALLRIFLTAASPDAIVVVRTLDAGADKPFPALEPYIGTLVEANPALGLRGIRIHLKHEELLRSQLRALLRACAETKAHMHIMFPMIATLEEVRRVRFLYIEVQQDLQQAGIVLPEDIQIGIMVETPAAAFMADVLAREVDFFSIGANDLTQYTMAVDRTNSYLAGMFGKLEPAVWRLIASVVQAGKAHGKMVAVCGEMAADPQIGPALVGLGVQELSMSPSAIVQVKAALHTREQYYWQHLARKMLEAETVAEMQQIMQVTRAESREAV
jgi:phosphoenolpyruvate-protein phosphotransferase